LGGYATDNVAVASVAWINDRGGNGNATLLGNAWTANGVVLQVGQNILTVTASDAAGNSTQTQITIDRLSPAHNSITLVGSQIPGRFRFRFYGQPRWKCEVQSSTNLATWAPLFTNTVTVLGYFDVENANAINSTGVFYRVKLLGE
jgi:hypothetical protein